jgi:hypothetical protein
MTRPILTVACKARDLAATLRAALKLVEAQQWVRGVGDDVPIPYVLTEQAEAWFAGRVER